MPDEAHSLFSDNRLGPVSPVRELEADIQLTAQLLTLAATEQDRQRSPGY